MSIAVYHWTTQTAEQIAALVLQLAPTKGFVCAGHPTESVLLDRSDAHRVIEAASHWAWGRAFDSAVDVQWRHADGVGTVSVSAANGPTTVPTGAQLVAVAGWCPVEHSPERRPDTLLLWSPHDQRIGADVAFPTSLQAVFDAKHDVAIQIQDYEDENGRFVWRRYRGITNHARTEG